VTLSSTHQIIMHQQQMMGAPFQQQSYPSQAMGVPFQQQYYPGQATATYHPGQAMATYPLGYYPADQQMINTAPSPYPTNPGTTNSSYNDSYLLNKES